MNSGEHMSLFLNTISSRLIAKRDSNTQNKSNICKETFPCSWEARHIIHLHNSLLWTSCYNAHHFLQQPPWPPHPLEPPMDRDKAGTPPACRNDCGLNLTAVGWQTCLHFSSPETPIAEWYSAEGPGLKTWVVSQRVFKMDFHQQKLSSLSIACNVKLEGALYSVFYAEASKRHWTSRNK